MQNAMEQEMLSVNTNYGAMVALQNLNQTNSELSTVQSRINTGMKVASAKDDGGIYAIAQRMRSDVAAFGAVQNSLDRAVSTVDTALAAGEAVSDLLTEMKAKALAATDTSLDTASRDALNEDFTALKAQIDTIVDNAEFNGANLLQGGAADVVALANQTGSSTITVQAEVLGVGDTGSAISLAATDDIATATDAGTTLAKIETAIDNVSAALSRLGTGAKSLEIHKNFVGKLSDQLEKGIGNLVDADMAKESARLQALQVQQQLGVQALSIANSQPNTVLSLFR